MRGNTFEWRDGEQGSRDWRLLPAALCGWAASLATHMGFDYCVERDGRFGMLPLVGIIGIIGIAVPAIAYAASAGWRAAGGLGMAFQHYRMRGRGDGMRVFRVDLRRIAMEGCGLVRGQKRRKRRCHAGTYDISRSEFEQTCKRLPD